ncbi:MAG: VOC family protein [Natronomonas sp.]
MSTLPPETEIGRVGLRVTSLEETIDFYTEVVGLVVQSRTADRAELGAGETTLLVLCADPDAEQRSPDSAGLFHVAVRVPSKAALGAVLRRIQDRWHLDGASDHHVSEALYLTDPEGNGVEIYYDRPRESWPTTADGRIEMATLPLSLGDLRSTADDADPETVPPETDIGHVHLEVTDFGAFRSFYVDTLGFDIRQEMDRQALFLAAGGYHHHVGANTWNHRRRPADGECGLAWYEISVPDVESLRRRLDSTGVSVRRLATGIEVTDPDGMVVRIVPAEGR